MDPIDDDQAKPKRRRPGKKEREREDSIPTVPTKPTVILLKSAERADNHQPKQLSVSPPVVSAMASAPIKIPDSTGTGTPIVMLRTRRKESDSQSNTGLGAQSIPSMLASEGLAGPSPSVVPSYQIQRNPHAGHGSASNVEGGGSLQSRLAAPPEMSHSVKIIDETMQWCDNGMEMLMDQTDFFVIGAIGLQGSGKSTILSMLAGNTEAQMPKSFVFRPQTREAREAGGHQTTGVDMYVTQERVILLDTQPMLSPSVMDFMIHHDKKYPTEFSSVENCIEMQSLQIATFLLTVCNVVIVALDWFVDRNFIKFLQTTEMLKPAKPSGSHEGGGTSDESSEYYPHIVFTLNKATRPDFSADAYDGMQKMLQAVMKHTKLKVKGQLHIADGEILASLNPTTAPSGLNLFVLPEMETSTRNSQSAGPFPLLDNYRGHPSFEKMTEHLYHSLVRLPRNTLTHTTLSEKNWFHYAARTWDAVKKSQLLAEYNRLLP